MLRGFCGKAAGLCAKYRGLTARAALEYIATYAKRVFKIPVLRVME
jgi:hypothetical protein